MVHITNRKNRIDELHITPAIIYLNCKKKRNVIGLDVLGWITLFLFHGFPLTLFFYF